MTLRGLALSRPNAKRKAGKQPNASNKRDGAVILFGATSNGGRAGPLRNAAALDDHRFYIVLTRLKKSACREMAASIKPVFVCAGIKKAGFL